VTWVLNRLPHLGVGVDALAVAAGFMTFGYLLVDAVVGRRSLGRIERWALAFPALLAFSFLLMLAHIATGGNVFSRPWIVRGVTSAVAAGLVTLKLVHRADRRPGDRASAIAALSLVAVGVVVWGNPVFRILPLYPVADINWHMGWTSQLLVGHTTPTSPLAGAVPNYYPWLYHAFLAFLTVFTPGGRAYLALGPAQFLQVSGAILALFAFGSLVGRTWKAGAGVAILGALTGGFGFLIARRFDVVMSPRGPTALAYGGDLLFVRSYNPSFSNITPPFPRDVALTLLPAFLFLAALGLERRSRTAMVAAGVVLGLIGLTGGEAFFVAMGVAIALVIIPCGLRRRQVAVGLLVPAVVVYATWLVPLLVTYVRLGGFVNTTVVGPVTLPPWALFVSLGLILPLSVWGGAREAPRAARDGPSRVLLALLVVAGVFVFGSSLVPALLGKGFDTLGRRHRYWPLFVLAVAIYAGLGASDLVDRARRASRSAAVAAVAFLLLFTLPSPAIASLALIRNVPDSPRLTSALEGGGPNLLTVAAQAGRAPCVVSIDRGGFRIFAYAGYQSVVVDVGEREENLARVRWKNIDRYQPSDAQRLADSTILTTGSGTAAEWLEVAHKYGVNYAYVERAHMNGAAFGGLTDLPRRMVQKYVVITVAPCGR
jgi:hypothetical protein